MNIIDKSLISDRDMSRIIKLSKECSFMIKSRTYKISDRIVFQVITFQSIRSLNINVIHSIRKNNTLIIDVVIKKKATCIQTTLFIIN